MHCTLIFIFDDSQCLPCFHYCHFPETSTVTESEVDTEVDTDYESFTDK